MNRSLLLSLLLVALWLTMIGLTFPVACLFVFGSR